MDPSSVFDLSSVYSFPPLHSSPDEAAEKSFSRADSPILGAAELFCPSLSRSSSSSLYSPLPPSSPPTRRSSRHISLSSSSSLRNAIYVAADFEEPITATLLPSPSLPSLKRTKSIKRATLSRTHIPSVSQSSCQSSGILSLDEPFCSSPVEEALEVAEILTDRHSLQNRILPFDYMPANFPLEPTMLGRNSLSTPHISPVVSSRHLSTAPAASSSLDLRPSELSVEDTFCMSPKRGSADSQSPTTSRPSSPILYALPQSWSTSFTHISTPNTSPASTWSRSAGRQALESVGAYDENNNPDRVPEDIRANEQGCQSRWSLSSSVDIEPPSSKTASIALSNKIMLPVDLPLKTGTESAKASHEAALRQLEGSSPQYPEYQPKTGKKRQRLRSLITRLSHLPSPHPSTPLSDIPASPSLPPEFKARLTKPLPRPPAVDHHNPYEASFAKLAPITADSMSLIDMDPFRASDVMVVSQSRMPPWESSGSRTQPPSLISYAGSDDMMPARLPPVPATFTSPRKSGSRSRVKTFFFS